MRPAASNYFFLRFFDEAFLLVVSDSFRFTVAAVGDEDDISPSSTADNFVSSMLVSGQGSLDLVPFVLLIVLDSSVDLLSILWLPSCLLSLLLVLLFGANDEELFVFV